MATSVKFDLSRLRSRIKKKWLFLHIPVKWIHFLLYKISLTIHYKFPRPSNSVLSIPDSAIAFVRIELILDFVFRVFSTIKCILVLNLSEHPPNTAIIWIFIRKRKHTKLRTVALKSVFWNELAALDKQTVDLYDASELKKRARGSIILPTIWYTYVQISLMALIAVKAALSWEFPFNQARPTRTSAKRNRCINATPFIT